MILCKIAGLDKNMHRKIPVDPKKSWFISMSAWIISQPWMWEWLAPLGGVRGVVLLSRCISMTKTRTPTLEHQQVPHEQLSLLSRQPELFSERLIEILSTRMWLKDNYFYHGYITGVFAKDCCPRYMSAEFYPKLKERVHKVTLWHGLLGDAAKKRNDWTVISLLDSMDWMPFEMVAGLVYDIIPCVDKKNARIFWRSFAPDTEVHSPVLAQLFPDVVPDYDRVGWYLSQWECKVPEKFDIKMIKAEAASTEYVVFERHSFISHANTNALEHKYQHSRTQVHEHDVGRHQSHGIHGDACAEKKQGRRDLLQESRAKIRRIS